MRAWLLVSRLVAAVAVSVVLVAFVPSESWSVDCSVDACPTVTATVTETATETATATATETVTTTATVTAAPTGPSGSADDPVTVRLGTDTEAWMLCAAGLLVLMVAALLATSWGGTNDD